jgi:hypothetical protein
VIAGRAARGKRCLGTRRKGSRGAKRVWIRRWTGHVQRDVALANLREAASWSGPALAQANAREDIRASAWSTSAGSKELHDRDRTSGARDEGE